MKKAFYLILCGLLVMGVTGCNNNSQKDNNKENNNIQNDNNEEIIVEKTYYCEEKDDDDWYYYFYYENDELVKVKVLAAKWSGVFEEYSSIKAESQSYDGVSISKDSDFAYFEIDIKEGGMEYLTDAFSDFESIKNDTSWENVSKVMQRVASECEEK